MMLKMEFNSNKWFETYFPISTYINFKIFRYKQMQKKREVNNESLENSTF